MSIGKKWAWYQSEKVGITKEKKEQGEKVRIRKMEHDAKVIMLSAHGEKVTKKMSKVKKWASYWKKRWACVKKSERGEKGEWKDEQGGLGEKVIIVKEWARWKSKLK